jgi:hypothetical protein
MALQARIYLINYQYLGFRALRSAGGSYAGSGSFYQQAKKVRKTLIPTVFFTSLGPFIFLK